MKKSLTISMVLAMALAVAAGAAAESLVDLKATYDGAVKAATAMPGDYTANWQAAKAARKYGDFAVSTEAADWKTLAKVAAKEGMKFGEMASKMNPSGIEGWYWYGLCVGTYADCVSIFSALAEGLKDKTQKGFENAYRFDKLYDNGGPMLALGRFWQTIPGIAGQDRKKAEQLFTEYISLVDKIKEPNSDAWYFRGELYKDTGRNADAKTDLQKAVAMGNKEAAKVLAKLK